MLSMEKVDEKLVEEYLEGDGKALDFLVEKYLKPLYNFIFQLTQDSAASEDIVQETFLKMWKNLDKFDGEKKFSTWIFAIAKNTAFDWLKKKRAIAFSSIEGDEGENYFDTIEDESMLHSENLLAKIDSVENAKLLLSQLSPQMQAVLLLYHKYGFSLVEIAQIMGRPSNTVKSGYRRAIAGLRKNFSDKMPYLKPETVPAIDKK
ncbi:MAG: hypothetical protein ACD_56C00141G0020 [uncultured bacterium]|nr:MAG: hypothetical protein ACD_56C00141G0020 [uncultured bacterium]